MIIEYIFGPSVFITEEYPDTSLVYVPGTGESNVYIESIWVATSTGEGGGGGGGGVTDHGLLIGLGDDDHPQYFNQARGDARYYTESETDTLLAGKANTSHTHVIADVTGLQTELDGKQAAGSYAAATHTHVIADVTGLQTELDGKASATHTHIIGDVTGLQTALDGKAATSHSHVIADVTGLQTALDGKVDGNAAITPATNPVVTYDAKGLVTAGRALLASDQAAMRDISIDIQRSLGSLILAESLGLTRMQIASSQSMVDGTAFYGVVALDRAATITGVKFYQGVQGNYTADNNNHIKLYSYSAGVLTEVATTANNGDLWKGGANSIQTAAFTSTYAAAVGIYYIGILYNSSAQTTAPALGRYAAAANVAVFSSDLANSVKIFGSRSGQTGLPASENMSNISSNVNAFWLALY